MCAAVGVAMPSVSTPEDRTCWTCGPRGAARAALTVIAIRRVQRPPYPIALATPSLALYEIALSWIDHTNSVWRSDPLLLTVG